MSQNNYDRRVIRETKLKLDSMYPPPGRCGAAKSKGRHTLSTETSGANLLPDRSGLHRSPHSEPDAGPEREPADKHTVTFRGRWQKLPEAIVASRARRNERADRARLARELDHLTGHPHIPANLIEALQRGTAHENSLPETIVTVDGQCLHFAVSSRGTGIPEPDSQGVWDGITSTYRKISDEPYCADVVVPLPQEIAAIGWTDSAGQTVNVTPTKPPRLRGLLSVALFPLARAGDLMVSSATTTTSAAAALVLGTSSLSPVPVPADPMPDLQPKTGIAQRAPQVVGTLRPEPAKARAQVRFPTSPRTNVTTRTSAPRPAVTPAATRSTVAEPVTPTGGSPAPTERPEVAPLVSESATPAIPAPPAGVGLETLLPGLPSLLRGSRP